MAVPFAEIRPAGQPVPYGALQAVAATPGRECRDSQRLPNRTGAVVKNVHPQNSESGLGVYWRVFYDAVSPDLPCSHAQLNLEV